MQRRPLPFGLHHVCDVFERAADTLRRARINTELFRNRRARLAFPWEEIDL